MPARALRRPGRASARWCATFDGHRAEVDDEEEPQAATAPRRAPGGARSEERATATEFVELSADEDRAAAAYDDGPCGWYADCQDPRIQLLVHRPRRPGGRRRHGADAAHAGTSSPADQRRPRPHRPATVTTVVRSTGGTAPAASTAATGLAASVNAAVRQPRRRRVRRTTAGPSERSPYPVGRPAGHAGGRRPAAGHRRRRPVGRHRPRAGPHQLRVHPLRQHASSAARACKHNLTRTFLFPAKQKVDTFGLTQTVATMTTGQAQQVRRRGPQPHPQVRAGQPRHVRRHPGATLAQAAAR